MTREELEAVIWRHRPIGGPVGVDAILAAADEYALTAYGVTADRRLVLAHATGSTVHLARDRDGEPACHKSGVYHDPICTLQTSEVTCLRCKTTRAYRERTPA